MGRTLIWSLVALLGYVCIHLVIAVFLLQSEWRKAMKTFPAHEEGVVVVYQHDSYCTIAPGIRFPMHPRPWAAALVGLGFGLVVLGLIFLLHVPVQEPIKSAGLQG